MKPNAPHLHPDWQVWACEALMDEHPVDEVCAQLVAAGASEVLAQQTVTELLASPAMVAAMRPRQRLARRSLAVREQLLRTGAATVPQLDRPADGWHDDAVCAHLIDTYAAAGQPVVLRDFTAGWPAADWTWQGLRATHGDAVLRVASGRAQHDDPDPRFQALAQDMRFADLIDAIQAGAGDDLYVVSRSAVLDGPLAALRADLTPPTALVRPATHGRNHALWVGGSGTRTRLHHDSSHVLFVQIVGQKHWWLAPHECGSLEAARSGYYAPFDLDDANTRATLDPPGLRQTVLQPGDALWVPPGWWHQVRSLQASISAGFVGLTIDNRFAGLDAVGDR